MFGTYRIALALLVGFYHLVHNNYAGPPAVFGFFVLSGFLMTLIINGSYADGRAGFGRYLFNRFLRIYPGYYVAFSLAAVVVYFAPEAALRYSGAVRWPDDLPQQVAQFTIVGQDLGPRLVVTAWSLGYELIFYVFIGLIGQNRLACQAWFVLSVALVLGFAILAPIKLAGAGSLPYVSLAFSAGAMTYHWRDRMPWIGVREGVAAGGLLVAFCVMCGFILPQWWLRQYAALVATAIAVIAAAGLRNIPAPDRDKTLGDLAYPYFLLHHLVGLVISIPTALPRGWTLFVLTTPITLLLSHAVVRCVEKPIQRVRLQLRRPRYRALASG